MDLKIPIHASICVFFSLFLSFHLLFFRTHVHTHDAESGNGGRGGRVRREHHYFHDYETWCITAHLRECSSGCQEQAISQDHELSENDFEWDYSMYASVYMLVFKSLLVGITS